MTTNEPTNVPVFMFGFERSGTTMLSLIVGSHKDIAVPYPVAGLWYRLELALDNYNGINSPQDKLRIAKDLFEEERIQNLNLSFTSDDIVDDIQEGNYASLVSAFHKSFAVSQGKSRWANMDIATLDNMHRAHAWFPDAKFIHIVRDGRDVALSHETMPFGASNTLECAAEWLSRVRTNIRMGQMLPDDQYYVCRYEDLLQSPADECRKLCAFIGVEYDPEMLDFYKSADNRVPENRRWLWPTIDKPIQSENLGLWRRKMSNRKRIIFEGIANSLLGELGYDTYAVKPKSISSELLELVQFVGRGGRFDRLLSRLGIARLSQLERQHIRQQKRTSA